MFFVAANRVCVELLKEFQTPRESGACHNASKNTRVCRCTTRGYKSTPAVGGGPLAQAIGPSALRASALLICASRGHHHTTQLGASCVL